MRSIYCVLFSFVCMYIAVNIKKSERIYREFAGFLFLISLFSLIASTVCAIFGI